MMSQLWCHSEDINHTHSLVTITDTSTPSEDPNSDPAACIVATGRHVLREILATVNEAYNMTTHFIIVLLLKKN